MSDTPDTPTSPRLALLTGAAGGIGFALAAALAERGWRLAMTDHDPEALAKAVARLPAGRPAHSPTVRPLDVTDSAAFAALAAELGPVDLLVNNAGTVGGGEVLDLSLEHWDRVIDVNLKGAIHGIRACYPTMVERGRGHIVNIASLLGLAAAPLVAPYATSKFGLVGLSLAMRPEAALHGVGVTVVCPGIIDTPLLDRAAPDGTSVPISAPPMRAWTGYGMGRPQSPEHLAVEILAAIERDRAILVTPWRARLAWRLNRFFPGVAPRLMRLRLHTGARSG